jgi:hypothetical protein
MRRLRKLLDARGQSLFEYMTLVLLVGGIAIAVIGFVAPRWSHFMRALIQKLISPYTT